MSRKGCKSQAEHLAARHWSKTFIALKGCNGLLEIRRKSYFHPSWPLKVSAFTSGLVTIMFSFLKLWFWEHLLMGMIYWNDWYLTKALSGSYLHYNICWTESNWTSIFQIFESEKITVVQAKRCCQWEQNVPRELQPKAEGVSLVENGRHMSQREKLLGKKQFCRLTKNHKSPISLRKTSIILIIL